MHFFNLSTSCVVKIASKEIVANLSPERQTNATACAISSNKKEVPAFEDYSMEWSALWRLLIMETTSNPSNPSNMQLILPTTGTIHSKLLGSLKFVNFPTSQRSCQRCRSSQMCCKDSSTWNMCLVGNQPRNLLGKPYQYHLQQNFWGKTAQLLGPQKGGSIAASLETTSGSSSLEPRAPATWAQVTLSMRLLRRNCCLVCCRSCRNTWQYQKIRSESTFSKRLHKPRWIGVSMDSQTSRCWKVPKIWSFLSSRKKGHKPANHKGNPMV